MRRVPLLLLLAAGACVGPSGDRRVAPATSVSRPIRVPPPAEDPARFRQCLGDLAALGAKVQVLPDTNLPGGCSATQAVKLIAIGIPVTNLTAMKCGLALPFTQWVQTAVEQAAKVWLDAYVTKMESFGSFACRPINGIAGNALSEHGRANAVDIAALQLADGRRLTVAAGWNGPDANVRAFLRAVHASACRRFNVVLGPDANAFHHDHLHFDMGPGRACR